MPAPYTRAAQILQSAVDYLLPPTNWNLGHASGSLAVAVLRDAGLEDEEVTSLASGLNLTEPEGASNDFFWRKLSAEQRHGIVRSVSDLGAYCLIEAINREGYLLESDLHEKCFGTVRGTVTEVEIVLPEGANEEVQE